MDQQRRDQIERRWQAIYRKIAEAERTGESPLTGVDAEFYCDQLFEELDELEFELGLAYFEEPGVQSANPVSKSSPTFGV